MNPEERLKLQDMIQQNNVEDNTSKIQELKHSSLIRADVKAYVQLKQKYPKSESNEFFRTSCFKRCAFIHTHYTDLYNKLIKNELNLHILSQFLDVLEEIEEGKVDQHEGSFKIGNLLRKIYIDSALIKSNKLDQRAGMKGNKQPKINNGKRMSYKDYKASLAEKQS
jgi:hypothetical protein